MLNWLAARLRISQGIVDYVADDARQSALSKLRYITQPSHHSVALSRIFLVERSVRFFNVLLHLKMFSSPQRCWVH